MLLDLFLDNVLGLRQMRSERCFSIQQISQMHVRQCL